MQIAARGLTMEVTLEPGPLGGDTALTGHAVANLTDNAVRHNVRGGTSWVIVLATPHASRRHTYNQTRSDSVYS